VGVLSVGLVAAASAQSKGVKLITAADMKPYLRFPGAKELRGRSAPSMELDIAAKYLAVEAARIGLQPLMPDGSYFQAVPVEVTTISTVRSYLRVIGPAGETRFSFPQAFTTSGPGASEWSASGGAVCAGSALNGPKPAWDNALGIDLKGKFVVVLDTPPPATSPGGAGQPASAARTRLLREKGAIGIITVIERTREANLAKKVLDFDIRERLRFLDVDTVNPPAVRAAGAAPPARPQPASAPAAPFYTVEVRHEAGAAILGVSLDKLGRLIDTVAGAQAVAPRLLPRRSVGIAVVFDQRTVTTPNVVAYLPGSDPTLKDEYVVIGSHHDHNPPREGRIFPGSDDNASGCVAMLSIAKAMMVERPKRSVIFVWHTAEPNRFLFRSDQYPYIRYGIPGVWIFCGTTADYHQEGDVEEKADYGKMEKVTRLTYLVAMDVGNKPSLLKLDVLPEVATRGKHNMKVVWQRAAPPSPPR
jgi:hypothetical protein